MEEKKQYTDSMDYYDLTTEQKIQDSWKYIQSNLEEGNYEHLLIKVELEEKLRDIAHRLDYLSREVIGEYEIYKDKTGKFFSVDGGWSSSCGKEVELYFPTPAKNTRWEYGHIEHDRQGYYFENKKTSEKTYLENGQLVRVRARR